MRVERTPRVASPGDVSLRASCCVPSFGIRPIHSTGLLSCHLGRLPLPCLLAPLLHPTRRVSLTPRAFLLFLFFLIVFVSCAFFLYP